MIAAQGSKFPATWHADCLSLLEDKRQWDGGDAMNGNFDRRGFLAGTAGLQAL